MKYQEWWALQFRRFGSRKISESWNSWLRQLRRVGRCQNGRKQKVAEHTRGKSSLAFLSSDGAVSQPSWSAAGCAETDARIVFDRASAHARCCPRGHFDSRAAFR